MILKLVSIILVLRSVSAISALALGGEGEDSEVTLAYSNIYETYLLGVKTSFTYAQTNTPFTICFRERPITISNDTCQLTNKEGSYQCLGVLITFKAINTTGSYSKWTLSSDLLTKSDISQYTPDHGIDAATRIFNIDVQGKVLGTAFSFLPKSDTIYQVISTTTYDFDERQYPIKTNFINTFWGQFSNPSDNLLMQRQVLCYIYGNYVNLVFLGGVMRSGYSRYMAAFITYERSKKNFTQWVGLSFSKDKVHRDMLGVYPSTAQFDDLYSIYASAPFKDISINVNGTQDWRLEASSDKIKSGGSNWFYYTQLSRSYDTGDTKGDQVLMYKINNKFCYAAYFNTDQTITPLYNDKNYNHQLLKCFTPDISIYAPGILFTLLLLVITLLFI